MKLPFHSVVRMATVAAVFSAALSSLTAPPASAAVTTVRGLAYGYTANVSLGGGGPYERQGYGQVLCTGGAQVPAGCTDPLTAPTSASPSVSLPVSGGSLSQTDTNGAQAKFGPATIFGGKWPPTVANAPPSGPITVSTSGTTGPGGSVTSSVDIVLYSPPSVTVPGGVGPPPVEADEMHSTCTASETGISASTRIVNGVLALTTDGTGEPLTTEPIPTNPPVNYLRAGEITNVGDRFRAVFNEQIRNADGSITVNAYHLYMLGPFARGEMIVGSSTCGTTPAGPMPPLGHPVADFTGDGRTDISVFRPSGGQFLVRNGPTVFLGAGGDIPVPCDYNGDMVTDAAIFRPSVGGWYVAGQAPVFYGFNGDVPVPGDYDGNGLCDIAIFRPSVGGWYIKDQPTVFFGFGGDIPVPADYDGDKVTDVAIFRPSVGGWYRVGAPTTFFGLSADVPVPGDYDGNGTADVAIYRKAVGGWYVNGQATQFLGLSSDIPQPGDYDGNGATDRAVYRPSTGEWYVAGNGPVFFGTTGDIPLPLPSAIRMAAYP